MTIMKPTRGARAIAVVLPVAAMFLALPVLAAAPSLTEAQASIAGAGFMTSSSLLTIDRPATAEGIRLAGKLSSAVKGAAIGSRAARGSGKSEEQTAAGNDQEAEKDTGSQSSRPDADALPSGPFKLVIPSESDGKPSSAAPVTAAQPEPGSEGSPPRAAAAADPTAKPAQSTATSPAPATTSPVRTLLDRGAKEPSTGQAAAVSTEAKPAGNSASAQRQSAAPASTVAIDSGCVAGCYAPTSTQLTAPSGRRAAAAQHSGSVSKTTPVAQTAQQNGIECLAGCDGIDGKPLPRAASGNADATASGASAATSQSGNNRVVIMRGNSRTKTYGVSR